MATANLPAGTSIKCEPMDISSAVDPLVLESKIVQLCSQSAEGISDAELQQKIPANIDAQQRAAAINRLLAQSRLDLFKRGTLLFYKLKQTPPETPGGGGAASQMLGASNEETMVYRVIEESANRGVWVRDIRNSTNLPQAMLNKVLKTLESRKLVKSVKAVGVARKKMYMLFELEPDSSLTGGVFYSEQEFDMQFVDLLNQQFLKYLRTKAQMAAQQHPTDLLAQRQASRASAVELRRHVEESRVSTVDLSLSDVERVLETVVYDGAAEKESSAAGAFYHAVPSFGTGPSVCGGVDLGGLAKTPCTFCPLIADCRPRGLVSPATCVYFNDWLSVDR